MANKIKINATFHHKKQLKKHILILIYKIGWNKFVFLRTI